MGSIPSGGTVGKGTSFFLIGQMKRKRQLFLFFLLGVSGALFATAYTPSSVPNPKEQNRTHYVANPDGILSAQAVEQMNRVCAQIDQLSEVEIAVVALEQKADTYALEEFAQALFRTWGIGKKGKNTGVLVLLITSSHEIRIHTGGGVEGLLPDGVCSDIIAQMIPYFKQNQWDKGLQTGLNQLGAILTTDEARAELLLEYVPKEHEWTELDYLMLYIGLAFLVLLLLSIHAYRELNRTPKALNNVRYQHAKGEQYAFNIGAIFFPLPNLFLLLWYRKAVKRLRLVPITCPECHHTMRRLSEQEEDAYLGLQEQTEEQVKSIDYDVWLCESCFNHLVLPYKAEKTKFVRCPHCGAVTYYLQSDVVLRSATQLKEGLGERTFHCKYCNQTDVDYYTLPKQPIVVVPMGGGGNGSSGGGFSGGSFGGGSSFGGGASGHW